MFCDAKMGSRLRGNDEVCVIDIFKAQ